MNYEEISKAMISVSTIRLEFLRRRYFLND